MDSKDERRSTDGLSNLEVARGTGPTTWLGSVRKIAEKEQQGAL